MSRDHRHALAVVALPVVLTTVEIVRMLIWGDFTDDLHSIWFFGLIFAAAACGIAIAKVCFHGGVRWILALSACTSATVISALAFVGTLFVPPPAGTRYKWGNGLDAAVFTAIFVFPFIAIYGCAVGAAYSTGVWLWRKLRGR